VNAYPTVKTFHSIMLKVNPKVVGVGFDQRSEKLEVDSFSHLAVPTALIGRDDQCLRLIWRR
jgi:hypothetical protein